MRVDRGQVRSMFQGFSLKHASLQVEIRKLRLKGLQMEMIVEEGG